MLAGAGGLGCTPLWTNQTQESRVYSHDGPIRCRKRGYILTMDGVDDAQTVVDGKDMVRALR
eukprot:1015275-Pyramimonas_sp.AAC.1